MRSTTKTVIFLDFKMFERGNIRLENELFDHFLAKESRRWDLVYIDGNHDREKTLYYFQDLKRKIDNDTLFIFDDIHWSRSMHQAWTEILASDMVTVSLDTFQWGLVFFRNEQPRQHFKIRL